MFRTPFLDYLRILWVNKVRFKVNHMFLKWLTISIHQEYLLKSNYFMEFPEFLEKYSNFEALSQQHVKNTKYSASIFKDGNNLYFSYIIHISWKRYIEKYFLVKFTELQ